MPHSGASWQPRGRPAQQPHEYVRGGTTKILTLFHPASGQVRLQPAARGTNAVLHPWLRERLSAILDALPRAGSSQDVAATRAAWAVWQAGLTQPFTLPDNLPPLRLLLVWDNLAGHKTPELVLWLCAHGVMPLYTPVGGSWLNMAESIERVLKRRALDGQHPHSPDEIGSWFEQTARGWNEQPTPLCVERQTPAAAATILRQADPSARGLGRLHTPTPSAQLAHSGVRMPNPAADDPLGRR